MSLRGIFVNVSFIFKTSPSCSCSSSCFFLVLWFQKKKKKKKRRRRRKRRKNNEQGVECQRRWCLLRSRLLQRQLKPSHPPPRVCKCVGVSVCVSVCRCVCVSYFQSSPAFYWLRGTAPRLSNSTDFIISSQFEMNSIQFISSSFIHLS